MIIIKIIYKYEEEEEEEEFEEESEEKKIKENQKNISLYNISSEDKNKNIQKRQ